MRIALTICLWLGFALATNGSSAQAVPGTASVPAAEAKAKKSNKGKTQKPKKSVTSVSAPATPVAQAPALVGDLQTIADQIHVGRMPCELGQSVTLLRDAHEPGRFNLFIKNHIYSMRPVQSATGALRLEDHDKGAVWLQLADKSMLMNSQLGQRMADQCQSPAQMQVAEAQKLSPPPHLLEPVPGQGLAQK